MSEEKANQDAVVGYVVLCNYRLNFISIGRVV